MTPAIFQTELWLPRLLAEVFEFFSDARNLQAITPAWLDFSIVTAGPIKLYPGAAIEYRLKVHGLPINWQTVITLWDPPHRFVDEQRRGPYRLWVHEHGFEARNGGTQVRDRVRYIPRGGRLIDRLFVRRDVQRIFVYRREKLLSFFADDKKA